MALSEKLQLLGAGLYSDIPDEITLKSIPTALELDYVGSEDFDQTMIDKILPQSVEEKINFNELLEIDYLWICRALRILNYGPYHTVNTIFCNQCHTTSRGEYRVNLNAVDCKPLPKGFKNQIVIKAEEFIDFDKNVTFKLPTIQQVMNAYKDKAFQSPLGKTNREFARLCYCVKSIGDQTNVTPVDVKLIIEKDMSSADYIILKDTMNELTDYGVRGGGKTKCPKCGSENAVFAAFIDDKFFRPTLGDLREWKNSKNKRGR